MKICGFGKHVPKLIDDADAENYWLTVPSVVLLPYVFLLPFVYVQTVCFLRNSVWCETELKKIQQVATCQCFHKGKEAKVGPRIFSCCLVLTVVLSFHLLVLQSLSGSIGDTIVRAEHICDARELSVPCLYPRFFSSSWPDEWNCIFNLCRCDLGSINWWQFFCGDFHRNRAGMLQQGCGDASSWYLFSCYWGWCVLP